MTPVPTRYRSIYWVSRFCVKHMVCMQGKILILDIARQERRREQFESVELRDCSKIK
jgi:hypothetical protein